MSPKQSPNSDIFSKNSAVHVLGVLGAGSSTEEDEDDLVDAVTLNSNIQKTIEMNKSEDEMPTDEAITFNFNKSRDILDEEQGKTNIHITVM